MADYLRRALAAASRVHHVISHGSSVKINIYQCKLLSKILSDCFVNLQIQADTCLSSLSKYQNGELCKQLYWIAHDVEKLVVDCCRREWLNSGIMLGSSKDKFALKACKVEWCNTMLCMIMHASTMSGPIEDDLQLSRVEDAVAKCEVKMGGILRAMEAAAIQDQERFRSKLYGVRDSGSGGAHLAKYLLQRISGFEKQNSGIPMWEVKPRELKEVARIRMGHYGIIYECLWMNEKYAVKVFGGIKDERSFRHETSVLAGLWHPHIIPMVCCAVNVDEGECSLVMELMSEDLYSFMRRRVHMTRTVPFTLLAAIDTMLQIAEGMEYLHSHKIPHRDLKSSNILVNPVSLPELASDGYVQAKVADFGLAKTKGACATYAHQSHLSGTSRWMAPEVFLPIKNVRDIPRAQGVWRNYPLKADVYSYGVIWFEVLTGKVPFVDEKHSKLYENIKSGARPQLPETCPTSLSSLIQRCWDGDARMRPSFSKICKELRHLRSILITGDELELQALKDTSALTNIVNEVESEPLDDELDTFKSTLEAVKQMNSPETSLSLRLNTHQCHHLLSIIHETVTKIEKEIKQLAPFDQPFCAQQGKLSLEELYRIVKDAESLIYDCCNEQWLKAAIKLADSREVFAKSLSQLQWCASLIRINIAQVKTGVEVPQLVEENLRKAMAECERTVKRMYDKNKEFAEKDERALRKKFKLVIQGDHRDDCKLAQFLLRRLDGFQQNSDEKREPYSSWNVESKELGQGSYIGQGSFGRVYEITWLGGTYASKTYSGAENRSFQQEAGTLVGLKFHPHVVPMICCSVDKEGSCSLVMERMTEDLCTSMNNLRNSSEGAPFELHVAVDIMLQIAEGMQFLHLNNVVHRDLKSTNVLVNPVTMNGLAEKGYVYVKVADFGLAKTKATSSNFTQQTLMVGTTRWMAPELYRNPINLQKKGRAFMVDVYSYAMTCFEILTGRYPFNEVPNTLLREKVMKGLRPPLPPTCPRRLAALIRSCWDQEPSKRPSFEVICRELRHLKGLLLIGGDILLQSLDIENGSQPPEVVKQIDSSQCLRCVDRRLNRRFGRSISGYNPVREMADVMGCGLLFHSLSFGSYFD